MLSVNLFDPAVRENPFPTYARMRDESPVSMLDPGGIYALTRYADVVAAFRDTETFSSAGFKPILRPEWVGENPLADTLLIMDPPEHTKNRALISRAFVKDVIETLRPTMESIVDECLSTDKVAKGEEFDVVDELAMPLAGGVICDALGLSRELAPRLQRWSYNIARITPSEPEPAVVEEIKTSIAEQGRYLGEAIDERLKNPRNDIPSVLCQAEIDGERLTRDELVGFMYLLVGAGFETTIHLITKATMLLANRPEIHAALRADLDKIPNFVEEMLRYDGPTHTLMRVTTRDVEMHGVEIPAHSMVALMIGAANRDPEQFPSPEEFQIDRKVKGMLAFGHGAHVCIGAALGRLEAAICMRELVERNTRVEIPPGPKDWNYTMHVRGLNHLSARLIA